MKSLVPLIIICYAAAIPSQAQVACPTLSGFTGSYNSLDAIALSGDYVYVGSWGFRVFDVSDPSAPVEVGLDDTSVYGIALKGNYAFTGGYGSGLTVFDISNPSAPNPVANCPGRGGGFSLDVDGDYAYLVTQSLGPDDQNGLRVIDISDPLVPFEVGFLEGLFMDVEVVGGYAFVAVRDSGLWVVDVTDPGTPEHVATLPTVHDPFAIDVQGAHVYLAMRSGGLKVIGVVDPLNPSDLGSLAVQDATDLVVLDDVAYVADNWGKALRVIDVSSPSAPVEIGVFATSTLTSRLAAANGYAYLQPVDGPFMVIDVDPVYGCPGDVFANGFETGNTSEWSGTQAR